MAMKRCQNLHLYDPSKHSTCPHCGVSDLEIKSTRPKSHPKAESETSGEDANDSTRPNRPDNRSNVAGQRLHGGIDEGATVRVIKKELGIDPVVGWLVCIEGPDRGRDYRIKSERNAIGRSETMDIAIKNDDAISRENHAFLSYDPRGNAFVLLPGTGRGLVYLKEKSVNQPVELAPYDIIEIGKSKLIFVPFCGESYQWV